MNIGFVALCIIICTFNMNTELPQWWLTNLAMAYPFFWLGTKEKCRYIMKTPENQGNKVRKLTQIGVVGMIWLLVSCWNGYTDINIQRNGRCYLLFLVTGLTGTLLVIYLSEQIKNRKLKDVVKVVGRNSFIILITHYYICRGIIAEEMKYWKIKSNDVMQIVLTILIIGVYYGAFKIIQERKR